MLLALFRVGYRQRRIPWWCFAAWTRLETKKTDRCMEFVASRSDTSLTRFYYILGDVATSEECISFGSTVAAEVQQLVFYRIAPVSTSGAPSKIRLIAVHEASSDGLPAKQYHT